MQKICVYIKKRNIEIGEAFGELFFSRDQSEDTITRIRNKLINIHIVFFVYSNFKYFQKLIFCFKKNMGHIFKSLSCFVQLGIGCLKKWQKFLTENLFIACRSFDRCCQIGEICLKISDFRLMCGDRSYIRPTDHVCIIFPQLIWPHLDTCY